MPGVCNILSVPMDLGKLQACHMAQNCVKTDHMAIKEKFSPGFTELTYSGVVLREIWGDHCKSGPKCEFFFTTPFLGE